MVPNWARSKDGLEALKEIEREWPILKTADTLLAGQSFLRPLAIISAICRAGCLRRAGNKAARIALAPEPAVLLFCSILARCVAFPLSGDDAYLLHGPAGGMLPIAFDVICLTVLFCLFVSHSEPCRRMPLLAMFVFAVPLIAKNDLGIASDKSKPGQCFLANKAFILACVLEVMASLAHLWHVLFDPVLSGVGAVTIIQATSQFLAAYFYIHIFPPGGEMSVLAKGFGSEIVTGGSVVQLGVSLLAIAVHVARSSDAPQDPPLPPVAERQRRKRSPRAQEDIAPMPRDMTIMTTPNETVASESSEEPQLLKLAPGVPRHCCAPKACIVHQCGSLYSGEEVLEVRCSAGCNSAVHARCFRAASRTVRQQCAMPGCQGRVVRFGAICSLLESAEDSE